MSLPSSPEALQIRARILHRHRRRISFNAGHDDWTQDGLAAGLRVLRWWSSGSSVAFTRSHAAD